MHLTHLSLTGFRNLQDTGISLDAPLVAFVGNNGQGKTNILEAIGVLSLLKSFRTSRPQELLGWGGNSAIVESKGVSNEMTRTWRWSLQEGERSLSRDGRNTDPANWLASLRACHFIPEDTSLIRGEPSLRRALLDRAVFTIQPSHLGPVQVYKRLYAHKVALLRPGKTDPNQLEIIDEQLIHTGLKIMQARSETMERMRPIFERNYRDFSGNEPASVNYQPFLGLDAPQWENRWRHVLEQRRDEEIRRGRPLVGPQRDELSFKVHGQAARAFASQGQCRSLVLAWKLAEMEVARQEGEAPLFLMDDLGSELDMERTGRLMALLRDIGAQIFVTTTDTRYLPQGSEGRYYKVESGRLSPL